MPGESILLVEDSAAERDIAQTILEDAGYRVVTAANAAAALACPELADINLVVLDAMLDSVSGYETTRMLRQQAETHPIPILLLIPDEKIDPRQDISARGANGYLLKPYDSKSLLKKVNMLIDDQHLDDLARQYLSDAADALMQGLAEKHIKDAVERKTQIIIERCIQNVTSAVDARAREEVEKTVTALTAEKEQELVKTTVREVAQSMVEKLAERKVTEALEALLPEQTDKSLKHVADQVLPGLVRERVKDSLNNLLPREIQVKLEKAAEKRAPELIQELKETMEGVVGKTVQRSAKEILPELAERQFKIASADNLPRLVSDLVSRELQAQVNQRIEPILRDSARTLRRTVLVWNAICGAFVALGLGLMVYLQFFSGR